MSVIPRIFASTAWLLMGAFALKLVSVLGKGDSAVGYSALAKIIAVNFCNYFYYYCCICKRPQLSGSGVG